MTSSKRVVPEPMKLLLEKDIALTELFCKAGDSILPPLKYRNHFKFIEISCHGLPWIVVTMALLWVLWNPVYFHLQVNLIYGLLFDMLIITVLKAVVRRRRPTSNVPDMFVTVGPDQYSFPSGHVTRAFFLGYVFTKIHPINLLLRLVMSVWMVAVSVSRVLLRRHFLLDVLAGAGLGLAEGFVMSYLWLSTSTCNSLVVFLSDESLSLEGLDDNFNVDDL